jgi:spermidine/putrescine transport system permease protein
MDVALSRNGRRIMRVFFGIVLVFLYAPIAILLVFSFNNADIPAFPLSGFTLRWYHAFLHNGDLQAALETSAIVATITSIIAVALGILASIGISRSRFRGRGSATTLLLVPLVIPLVVLGLSLFLLFHVLGVQLSILTIVVGHVVIVIPYTILVLLPRLEQIDSALGEAAYDLGAGPLTTFRRVTLPLILPAVVSALLIAFTTSFDEYAVASFLAGPRQTFPIYLYSALRFPTQLPQVIAVAVVVLSASIAVIVAAELWRRRAEARLEAPA